MDEEVKYSSLNEYFEALLEQSKGVFSVFCEVFGEDRCDIQINVYFDSSCRSRCMNGDAVTSDEWESIKCIGSRCAALDIIVYFPEVDISNEKDKHHTIKELYVSTSINTKGNMVGPPQMLRTRYTTDELRAGYKHSHAEKLVSKSGLGFTSCCLGSAPIRSTVTELISKKCDLDRWNVYCLQIDQYVGIESLKGGPYVEMSKIGVEVNSSFYLYDWKGIREHPSYAIESWVLYKFLLATPINLVVRDGVLVPAMSALECALRITEIYKEDINTKEHLVKGVLVGNRLFSLTKGQVDISSFIALEGGRLLTFKGEPKCLSIDRCEEESVETIEIIRPEYLGSVIDPILIYINTAYEKERKYGELSRFDPYS